MVTAALLVSLLTQAAPPTAPAATNAGEPRAGVTPTDSVYRLHLADALVTGAATAAVAVTYALSNDIIHPKCPCDRHDVNGFDRWAIGAHSVAADALSNVSVALAVGLPLALDYADVGFDDAWLEDTIILAEALAVGSALVTAAKHIAQRPLPIVYAGLAPDLEDSAGGYRSFYSGHAATAFVLLSTYAMTRRLRHGEEVWPWVVTGVLGGSVAIERVAAGRHFPTDVIVGAIAGTAVGIVVPLLHQRDDLQITIVPPPDGKGALVACTLLL